MAFMWVFYRYYGCGWPLFSNAPMLTTAAGFEAPQLARGRLVLDRVGVLTAPRTPYTLRVSPSGTTLALIAGCEEYDVNDDCRPKDNASVAAAASAYGRRLPLDH
jgi:hypothetical protein